MTSVDADVRLRTGNRIFERNRDLILQVVSAFRISSRGGPPGEKLSKGFSSWSRSTREVEGLEAESPWCVRFVLLEHAVGVETVAVVELPLQWIAENLVGL